MGMMGIKERNGSALRENVAMVILLVMLVIASVVAFMVFTRGGSGEEVSFEELLGAIEVAMHLLWIGLCLIISLMVVDIIEVNREIKNER
jgi:hypothetical protein